MNKDLFEKARKLYPGTVRGIDPEWVNFVKESRSRDWKLCGWTIDSVTPLLKPAIEAQIAHRDILIRKKEFCPPWKHFKTWINNAWWTVEIPQTDKPKRTKCKCGKPSTHSIFVYFKDGARSVHRCDDCPDPEPDWRKRESNKG